MVAKLNVKKGKIIVQRVPSDLNREITAYDLPGGRGGRGRRTTAVLFHVLFFHVTFQQLFLCPPFFLCILFQHSPQSMCASVAEC